MVAIFVVLTVLLLVLVDVWMEGRRATAVAPTPVPEPIVPAIQTRTPTPTQPDLKIPVGRFLHPGHLWAQIRALGTLRLGLDPLLKYALGTEAHVSVAPPGTLVAIGDPIGKVQSEGRTIVVTAPFSGSVQAVNHKPSPGEWLCEIWAPNLGSEIAPLMMGETASRWLRTEVNRFREWLTLRPAFATLPDGGMPVPGAMNQLDQNAWEDFQQNFLHNPTDTGKDLV